MSALKLETPTRTVDVEDVDDIIGIAAEMKEADTDQLTVEELEEVASELEIPTQYVKRAIETLKARREADLEAEVQATQRRRQVRLYTLVSVSILMVVLFALAMIGQAGLRSALSEVEQRQAQVRNVMERQEAVESRYQNLPANPSRDAELAGAENRIRIERRRYDEVAAEYNAAAGGFPGKIWSILFGLPDRVPMSNEVDQW